MTTRLGIGQQVGLWTYGEPPLYVGIFEVVKMPDDLPDNVLADVALFGAVAHPYTIDAIDSMARHRCQFRISVQLTDKYDPESLVPYIYNAATWGVTSDVLMREEEGAGSLLLLLQEHPIEMPLWRRIKTRGHGSLMIDVEPW